MAEEYARDITNAELFARAMQVTTKEEAQACFDQCVWRDQIRTGAERDVAERRQREWIGYWFGNQTRDQWRRLQELYGFGHPYGLTPDMTPQEIFDKGAELGASMMRERAKNSRDGQSDQ